MIHLLDRADEAGLVLNPEVISCDFEKGVIKAFKRHFQNALIYIRYQILFIKKKHCQKIVLNEQAQV